MKVGDIPGAGEGGKADDGPLGRGYGDSCGAAHALELVGERWALLVMRELMLSPKRFTDLRAGLPGISANVLTQRLEKLEAVGIVERVELPPPAGKAYTLTPWGFEAEPILQVMGRWAARSPLHDPTLEFSAASLILSLRTMFAADRAAGVMLTLGMKVGRETFRASVADGRLQVGPGPTAGADAVVSGTARCFGAMIYGGVDPALLEANGTVAIAGDRTVLPRFARLFVLPPKVA